MIEVLKEEINVEVGCHFPKLGNYFFVTLSNAIAQTRKEISEEYNFDFPVVHVYDNSKIMPNSVNIYILDKNEMTFIIKNLDRLSDREVALKISRALKDVIIENLDKLKESDYTQKVDKWINDPCYDSYVNLFNYYTRIKRNDKKAFHWLKKTVEACSRTNLRKLAEYYSFGIGCEKNPELAEKIRNKDDENNVF